MVNADDVAEYWTDSRAALVVTAGLEVIEEIVTELGLPPDRPISVTDDKYALALWGEDLEAYLGVRSAEAV